MWKLVPILSVCLLLFYISDKRSIVRTDKYGENYYISKEILFFFFAAMIMAVFVGLRTRGNDTSTYRSIYESLRGNANYFKSIDWLNFAEAPGFTFINNLFVRLKLSTQSFLMIYALFTVLCYLWFIRKYSTNIFLSVYFMITMGVYTFTMAAIKQTVAVAILLIATDKAINKRYIQFVLIVLLAELFHPFAFVYLIVPFLFFEPWTIKTWWLLLGTYIIARSLSVSMDELLMMTELLGASYSEMSFIGEGVNIFRVAVVWVPVFISFWGRRYISRYNDRICNLFINLTMINAMIMFIGLFGTANYFARLANYFLIFQTLALPRLFKCFDKRSERVMIMLSMFCFFAYFYYGQVLAQGRFDDQFSFMNIIDFIKQIFYY